MPLYDFLNNETGEVEEHNMSYTKLDQFKDCLLYTSELPTIMPV